MSSTLGSTEVVNANGRSIVWPSYVDLDLDVKPWIQYPVDDTTFDDQLQLLIDMTCQWAQKKIGRPIGPTTIRKKFNGWSGWNGAYFMLPYEPILDIVSVIEYWGVSGPHVLSEQTFTNQVDGFQCDYQTGMLTRVFPGLVQKPWFPGSMNIEVVWRAGYNPLPADWKVATLEMVGHWFRNVFQQSANNLGAGTGDAYDPDVVANGLWNGTPLRIAGLLDDGVHVGIG